MNLKEKFENNLFFVIAGFSLASFFSGLGVYQGYFEMRGDKVVSESKIHEYDDKLEALKTENADLKNEIQTLIAKYEKQTETTGTDSSSMLKEKDDEIAMLKEKISSLISQRTNEAKGCSDIVARAKELERRESELRNREKGLEEEKSKIDNIKKAQVYMDTYLEKYAHVDLSKEINDLPEGAREDYIAAESLLKALFAIADRISEDNLYHAFIYNIQNGLPQTGVVVQVHGNQ